MESYVGDARVNFSNNFNNLFDEPQLNSLSLRVSYYLDYNRVKTWFGPKNKTQTVGFGPRNEKMSKSGSSIKNS
jgi:hypothetical protein